uniref:Uncharacterized protein n=1 Tax=Bosea sp. NBC_00436 TaxID=2969620 RepID=A0A9E8CIU4_9HYPH
MQDDNLVAAEPARHVTRADAGADTPGHLGQHLVAAAMPEGVVHELEIIEIDKEHRDIHAIGAVAREFMFKAFEQKSAREQAGQRIMRRAMHQSRNDIPQLFDL